MLFQAKEGLLLSLPNSPLLNLRWKEGSQLPESPPLFTSCLGPHTNILTCVLEAKPPT